MTLAYFAAAWFFGTVAAALGWDARVVAVAGGGCLVVIAVVALVRRRPGLALLGLACAALFTGAFLRFDASEPSNVPSGIATLNDGPSVTFRAMVDRRSGQKRPLRLDARRRAVGPTGRRLVAAVERWRPPARGSDRRPQVRRRCWRSQASWRRRPSCPTSTTAQYLARQGIDSIAYYPAVTLASTSEGNAAWAALHQPAAQPVVGAGERAAGAAGLAGAGNPAGRALRPASRPEGRSQRDEHVPHHRALRLQRDVAGGARHRRLRLAHRTAPSCVSGACGHRRLHPADRRLAEPRPGGDNGRAVPDRDAAGPAQQRHRVAARRRGCDGGTAAGRGARRLLPTQLCRDGGAHRARAPDAGPPRRSVGALPLASDARATRRDRRPLRASRSSPPRPPSRRCR